MNLFQLIVCPGLALLCLWEIARLVRGRARHGAYLRISIWIAALVSVAHPPVLSGHSLSVPAKRR